MKSKGKKEQEHLEKLGSRIRQLRKEKGYTNADFFAYEHEFSRPQYSRYEKGMNLTYLTLVRIVEAHGISMEEFFSIGFA